MKRVVLALLCCIGVFTTPAKAADLSGFYKWAEEVTIWSKFVASGKHVTIYVTDAWEDKGIPDTYRLWLPSYRVCIWSGIHRPEMDGVNVVVLLDNAKRVQNFAASGWIPFSTCAPFMETIKREIENSKH